MKIIGLLLMSFLLASCSEGQMADIEELAFRKTLEYSLAELCGEEDKACNAAVKEQVKSCMEKSDWRKFLDNEDDEDELDRFTTAFYLCIVDSEGNPYFEADA